MIKNLYHYNAHVTKVYDGDTITVDIDLGLGVWKKKQKIRLFGINTPELRGGTDETKAKGIAARDALRVWILHKRIVLKTIKDKTGKYGRLLGVVYFNDTNINDLLVKEGHAEVYLP